MLVPALLSVAVSFVTVATARGTAPWLRAAGILAALALGAHWVRGYRRGRFALGAELPEALALALVLLAAPGQPPLPLFGTTYRALYGRLDLAILRVAGWVLAIVVTSVHRGDFAPEDQIGKSGGLLLAAIVMQMLARGFEDVQRSERRLNAMLAHSTDVVTVLEAGLRVRWLAASITRVLGHDPAEMVGARFDEFVHPDDARTVRDALTSAAPAEGETTTVTCRMRDATGGYRHIEAIVGNRLHEQHIGGLLLTLRDVTERRALEYERLQLEWLAERVEAQRERQQLQTKLQRAQRLESVGQLAGGVAHDFNNLLTVILNYAAILHDDTATVPEAAESIDEIEQAAARGARLVRQLLQFSRGELTAAKPVSLNATLESIHGLLSGSIPCHARLIYDLEPGLEEIEADPTNVEQVIVNLVINARDALGSRGGTIAVSTTTVQVTPDAAVDLDVAPGAYARVTVADDGSGMDAQTLERALEPFFTTKPIGEGTGLGLSTVHGIVTSAGGYLAIDSQPGAGTRVHAHWPQPQRRPHGVASRALLEPARSGMVG